MIPRQCTERKYQIGLEYINALWTRHNENLGLGPNCAPAMAKSNIDKEYIAPLHRTMYQVGNRWILGERAEVAMIRRAPTNPTVSMVLKATELPVILKECEGIVTTCRRYDQNFWEGERKRYCHLCWDLTVTFTWPEHHSYQIYLIGASFISNPNLQFRLLITTSWITYSSQISCACFRLITGREKAVTTWAWDSRPSAIG